MIVRVKYTPEEVLNLLGLIGARVLEDNGDRIEAEIKHREGVDQAGRDRIGRYHIFYKKGGGKFLIHYDPPEHFGLNRRGGGVINYNHELKKLGKKLRNAERKLKSGNLMPGYQPEVKSHLQIIE
jgi:hypothetical protein